MSRNFGTSFAIHQAFMLCFPGSDLQWSLVSHPSEKFCASHFLNTLSNCYLLHVEHDMDDWDLTSMNLDFICSIVGWFYMQPGLNLHVCHLVDRWIESLHKTELNHNYLVKLYKLPLIFMIIKGDGKSVLGFYRMMSLWWENIAYHAYVYM